MDAATKTTKLAALARSSGGFAMVANDGRESLRGLLNKAGRPLEDSDMSDFKKQVALHLGPVCSAMLIDLMYGRAAIDCLQQAAPRTGRIIAVDAFVEPRFGPLAGTSLDRALMAAEGLADSADALKLFVFWRPDESNEQAIEDSAEFVEVCARMGVLSLLEGVVKVPATDPRFDDSLLDAARTLGALSPDLYKTQVPTLGRDGLEEVERHSVLLSEAVGAPWVALSNGIPAEDYADAVTAVCRGGASGFLAGRATWSPAITATNAAEELATTGADRLRSFIERVDQDARPWWVAAGLDAPRVLDIT